VEALLAHGIPKGEIKRYLRQHCGIGYRQAERVLSRARGRLREATGQSREDHVADSYAVYRNIVSSASASDRDKIRAQNAIDKLLGLRKPVKVAVTDPSGEHEAAAMQALRQAALADPASREALATLAEQLGGLE
jgi:hypothetical protein